MSSALSAWVRAHQPQTSGPRFAAEGLQPAICLCGGRDGPLQVPAQSGLTRRWEASARGRLVGLLCQGTPYAHDSFKSVFQEVRLSRASFKRRFQEVRLSRAPPYPPSRRTWPSLRIPDLMMSIRLSPSTVTRRELARDGMPSALRYSLSSADVRERRSIVGG